MSETVLVLALAVLGTQDTVLARLRFRADSLAAEWRRASALADIADSLQRERAQAGRDTIAVGALRIVVNPSPLPVRAAATRAWRVLDSLFGEEAQLFARSEFLLRAFDPDTAVRRPPLRAGTAVPWNLSEEQLTTVLLANLPAPSPDSRLTAWLDGSPRALLGGRHDRTRVYIRLVTAPSQTARDCFLGDLASCASVLALGSDVDVDHWYPSPAERRALITQTFSEHLARPATRRRFDACARGEDDACTELLHAVPREAIPQPLAADARALVLDAALRVGGRDAYQRLLRMPDASMGERLAAASGVPRDTLLARWRSEILAAPPVPVALTGWTRVIIVGWILAFAACGLRSSRWRLD